MLYLFDGNLDKQFWQIKQTLDDLRPTLKRSLFKGIFSDKGKKFKSQILGQDNKSNQKKYNIFDNDNTSYRRNQTQTQIKNPVLQAKSYEQKNTVPQKRTNQMENLSAFYKQDLNQIQDPQGIVDQKEAHNIQNISQGTYAPRPLNKTTFDSQILQQQQPQNPQTTSHSNSQRKNLINDFYTSKYFNEQEIYQSELQQHNTQNKQQQQQVHLPQQFSKEEQTIINQIPNYQSPVNKTQNYQSSQFDQSQNNLYSAPQQHQQQKRVMTQMEQTNNELNQKNFQKAYENQTNAKNFSQSGINNSQSLNNLDESKRYSLQNQERQNQNQTNVPQIPLIDIQQFQSQKSLDEVPLQPKVQNSYAPGFTESNVKDEVMREYENNNMVESIHEQARTSSLADQFRDLYQQQEQIYMQTTESKLEQTYDQSFINSQVQFTQEDEYFQESEDEKNNDLKDLNQYKKNLQQSIDDSGESYTNQNTSFKDAQSISGKVKQNLFQSNDKIIEYSQTEETPKIPYLQKVQKSDDIQDHSLQTGTNLNDDWHQNQVNQTLQNTKNISKFFFRFDPITQMYVKIVQYEDGSEEQVVMDQQEQEKMRSLLQNTSIPNINQNKAKESTPQQNNISQSFHKPHGQVKQNLIANNSQQSNQTNSNLNQFMSKMIQSEPLNITEDVSITIIDNEHNVNFILVPGQNQMPKLLYRQKLQSVNPYQDLANVVNSNNKLKPSMYHQVDQLNELGEQSVQVSQNYEYMIQSKLVGSLQQNKTTIGSKNYIN